MFESISPEKGSREPRNEGEAHAVLATTAEKVQLVDEVIASVGLGNLKEGVVREELGKEEGVLRTMEEPEDKIREALEKKLRQMLPRN